MGKKSDSCPLKFNIYEIDFEINALLREVAHKLDKLASSKQVRRSIQMSRAQYNRSSILTKREREVFELLLQDKTTKDIASELFISEKTVRNHISNAIQKLGVKGRAQAIVELLRLGELTL